MDAGFALGWLGWLGYELKRETGGSDLAAPLPDAALIHAARGVVLDHDAGEAWLLALAAPDAEAWLDAAEAAVVRLDAAPAGKRQSVGRTRPAPPAGRLPSPRSSAARTRAPDYLAKVRAAQAQIAEGNTYEVCLTTVLACARSGRARTRGGPIWRCAGATRPRSPASCGSGTLAVASTSPERFLQHRGRRLDARRADQGHPRGAGRTPAADAALRAELASSPKDRAENIMIVDLLRNDLVTFAVTRPRWPCRRLCAIESYATVHQMVSTIDARLRPDAVRAEAVAAAFPAGSMTGAPKISTMAILDRLEDGRAAGRLLGRGRATSPTPGPPTWPW